MTGLEPPPENEREERQRRARITLAELVKWYKEQGLPLDVKLYVWERTDVDR